MTLKTYLSIELREDIASEFIDELGESGFQGGNYRAFGNYVAASPKKQEELEEKLISDERVLRYSKMEQELEYGTNCFLYSVENGEKKELAGPLEDIRWARYSIDIKAYLWENFSFKAYGRDAFTGAGSNEHIWDIPPGTKLKVMDEDWRDSLYDHIYNLNGDERVIYTVRSDSEKFLENPEKFLFQRYIDRETYELPGNYLESWKRHGQHVTFIVEEEKLESDIEDVTGEEIFDIFKVIRNGIESSGEYIEEHAAIFRSDDRWQAFSSELGELQDVSEGRRGIDCISILYFTTGFKLWGPDQFYPEKPLWKVEDLPSHTDYPSKHDSIVEPDNI